MSDKPDSASFNKNYKLLKDTADWLSQKTEPDIDQLIPKVEAAMQAYKVCKARLDAVQATLSQYFEDDGDAPDASLPPAGGDAKPGRRRPSEPPTDGDGEDEEDIPF